MTPLRGSKNNFYLFYNPFTPSELLAKDEHPQAINLRMFFHSGWEHYFVTAEQVELG